MKKILVPLLCATLMMIGCGKQKNLYEYTVISTAMENTIIKGDTIYFDLDAYKNKKPERLDIVLFKYPDDKQYRYFLRIIGLPGETVNMIDGKVYINGSDKPIDDSYCLEEPLGDFGSYTVPDDCYFLLGDNRNYSRDSRFWENSYAEYSDIIGKLTDK